MALANERSEFAGDRKLDSFKNVTGCCIGTKFDRVRHRSVGVLSLPKEISESISTQPAICKIDVHFVSGSGYRDFNDFFAKQRARGIEKHSIFADPEFADPSKNDFTVQQGALAEQTGFDRFSLARAGPRERVSWKIAAERIREKGGHVFLDLKSGRPKEVNLNKTERIDRELAGLICQLGGGVTDVSAEDVELDVSLVGEMATAFPDLEWLNLYRTKIGRGGAQAIGEMRSLTHLPVGETGISDGDLVHLSGLSRLKYLGLRGNAVSKEGLSNLGDLKNLKELNLAQTRIEDAGVAWLAEEFPKLEKLWLHDTGVTGTGLAHLADLKSLRELFLQRTRTTAEEVGQLRRSLPGCRVFWETDPE